MITLYQDLKRKTLVESVGTCPDAELLFSTPTNIHSSNTRAQLREKVGRAFIAVPDGVVNDDRNQKEW